MAIEGFFLGLGQRLFLSSGLIRQESTRILFDESVEEEMHLLP